MVLSSGATGALTSGAQYIGSGVCTFTIVLTGGGGAGGSSATSTTGMGGNGASFTATFTTAEAFFVKVGSGGAFSSAGGGATALYTSTAILAVAGGGGGGGSVVGGDAGPPGGSAQAGANYVSGSTTIFGGRGGTQSAGGASGSGETCSGAPQAGAGWSSVSAGGAGGRGGWCGSGALVAGGAGWGAGGSAYAQATFDGGGGGGGYYGGGGGNCGCFTSSYPSGGGGGSSYVNTSMGLSYGPAYTGGGASGNAGNAGSASLVSASCAAVAGATAGYTVITLAGSGSFESADGTGTRASFGAPTGVAVDASGNVFVADIGSDSIRKVAPGGIVSTLAGRAGALANGVGTSATFREPRGVAVDANGNIIVADKSNDLIRKVTPAGVVSTLAGSIYGLADGSGAGARFRSPAGVAVDASGNVFVADSENYRVRKVTPGGAVSTLAGSGDATTFDATGYFRDGPGVTAKFHFPLSVAIDASGDVIVADTWNGRIRKVTPAGVVSTLAGNDGGNYWEGTGTNAAFHHPSGVAIDASGNVIVADSANNVIRKVTPAGVVSTLAGNKLARYADGVALDASFSNPLGVAVDVNGNVTVADTNNGRIRIVVPPFRCPAGSFAISTSSCALCPRGRYGSSTGNTAPTCDGACSAGYYCPEGSANATQAPCAAGSYGSSTGNIAPTCDGVCSAGYYCPAGSTSATQAPCAAGSFGSSTGNTAPTCDGACSGGTFSAEGWTRCTTCPDGTYCPRGASAVSACPVGSYCLANASDPTLCTGWTFGALPSQASCGACPANNFCTGRSATPCVPDGRCAAAGCASGYKGMLCADCMGGYFKENSPLGGGFVCQVCPSSLRAAVLPVLPFLLAPILLLLYLGLSIYHPLFSCLSCCAQERAQKLVEKATEDSFFSFTIKCHLSNLVLLGNNSSIPFPLALRAYLLDTVNFIVSLNPTVVHPECAIEWSILHTWCVIAGLFVFSVAFSSISFFCCKGKKIANLWVKFCAQSLFQSSLKVAAYTTVDDKKYLTYQMSLLWFERNFPLSIDHRAVFFFSVAYMAITTFLLLLFLICKRIPVYPFIKCKSVSARVLSKDILLMKIDTIHNFLLLGGAFSILWGPGSTKNTSAHVLTYAVLECVASFAFYKLYYEQLIGKRWEFLWYSCLTVLSSALAVFGVACAINVAAMNNEALAWLFVVLNLAFLFFSLIWFAYFTCQTWHDMQAAQYKDFTAA
jgi:sugar lactone lactonase YvrE